MNLSGKHIALIGCGDIGCRLANLLIKDGAQVHGFRRNKAALPQGITAHALDVTNAASLQVLADTAFDYVVITLTPDRFSEETYRQTYVEGLANILSVLNRSRLQRLLWVSSTSVYHHNDDSWVDETSATQPAGFSGRLQLEAESLLSDIPQACIVRFAGIYRDDSYRLLEQLKAGEVSAQVVPDPYSNRIHVDDCAGVLAHLIGRDAEGLPLERVYLGVDCEPVRYSALVHWLAETSGLALKAEGAMAIARAGSKRCSNQRLLDSGYRFVHPDFRSGLQALAKACKP